MSGWSLADILRPPTPVTPRNGSASPRGKSLWDDFVTGAKDTINVMVQAGTERAVERLRRSPAGEKVKQEFVRQEIGDFLRSPAAWIIGALVVLVLVGLARR